MNIPTQLKIPFVSVLICSLNGEKHISDCLDSLKEQTYGRKNFEIIVIDDGSTDDTSAIARAYEARVIRFETNRGIPVARNAGLSNAKGKIVAFIDDDCIANSNWLENLVLPFKDKTIVAAGGKILAFSLATISERYMEATGYGNPARALKSPMGGLMWRLFGYFATMTSPIMFEKEIVSVLAIYTANAAYRKNFLLEVGGFDESLKTNEDSDISARLRVNGGRIIYVPNAIVKHRHYKKLSRVVHEPYRRMQNTLQFYLKDKKMPPIFPIPILYLFVLFLIFFLTYEPIVFICASALLPVILYGWWILRGVRERKLEYVWYPYIQLVVESVATIGMLKGLFGITLSYIYKDCIINSKEIKQ